MKFVNVLFLAALAIVTACHTNEACQESEHGTELQMRATGACTYASERGITKQPVDDCVDTLVMLYHSEPKARPGTLLKFDGQGAVPRFFVQLVDDSIKMFHADGRYIRVIPASEAMMEAPIIY